MNTLALRLGIDVDYYGISIKQPKVKDYLTKSEDEVNAVATPFLITKDIFDDDSLEFVEPLELFLIDGEDGKCILDKVFNNHSAREILCSTISQITNEPTRYLELSKEFVIGESVLLDNEKFNELRQIVKMIYNKVDIEVEHPPRNMSERQSEIWQKIKRGRERFRKDDTTTIADYVNMLGAKMYVEPSKVLEMSVFELMSIVKAILEVDSYETALKYKTSYKFDVKDEISHWTEKTKVRV